MKEPYAPPKSAVADVGANNPGGWSRVTVSIAVSSALALVLSWFVAPQLAGFASFLLNAPLDPPGPVVLVFDAAFSFGAFTVGCWWAATLAPHRRVLVIVAVAFIGWLVYFVEAGGLWGMLQSQYPLWYEFLPIRVAAAAVAWRVTRDS